MDDLHTQWETASNAIVTVVTTYGLRVLAAIAILVAGWMAARFLYGTVARLCARSAHIDSTVGLFLANGARYLTLAFTFVAVLTTFGIATTSFIAVLGAFGIAVGLALQGTLSNLAAGIMLIVFRPFRIGDRIETANVGGTTREVNLFYTEVDGDDNARIIIPNGKLWGEIVRIPTRSDAAHIELRYQRPGSEDIGTGIARLKELIERDKRVLRVSDIGVESISGDNYTLAAHAWVERADQTTIRFDLNRTVKEQLAPEADQRQQPAPAVERRAG